MVAAIRGRRRGRHGHPGRRFDIACARLTNAVILLLSGSLVFRFVWLLFSRP